MKSTIRFITQGFGRGEKGNGQLNLGVARRRLHSLMSEKPDAHA